jgi:glycosyltransferase involved in cell wall biosynthesis
MNSMEIKPKPDKSGAIVFLVPDASRTGAPIQLLHLLRWVKSHTDLPFRVVLFQDGPLATDFFALAPTMTLTEVGVGRSNLVRKIGKIPFAGPMLKGIWHRTISPRTIGLQPRVIYANSVASARLIRQMAPVGVPLIVHIHELEQAIQITAGLEGMAAIKSCASRYIAISSPVRQNLILSHDINPSLIDLVPSFIPIDETITDQIEERRHAMRLRLGIPDQASVIGGCGLVNWRKGVDMFVEMAYILKSKFNNLPVHFIWVGKVLEDEFAKSIMKQVETSGLSSVFHFVGEQPNSIEFFCGLDVFVLSSREEPMGLVALEAASVGKPVICFADVGGMPDFVGTECGRTISPMTGQALANGISEILTSSKLQDTLGRRASEKVRSNHHIDVIAPQILKIIQSAAQNG